MRKRVLVILLASCVIALGGCGIRGVSNLPETNEPEVSFVPETDILSADNKHDTYSYTELQEGMNALTAAVKNGDIILFGWGIRDGRVKTQINEDQIPAAHAIIEKHPCIEFEVVYSELTRADHADETEDTTLSAVMEYPSYPSGTDTICFTLRNNSNNYTHYSHQYGLEVLLDEVWYTIPLRVGVVFTMELRGVRPHESESLSELFKTYNYDFPEGRYRLVVNYCIGEFQPSVDGFNMVCFSEFDISD